MLLKHVVSLDFSTFILALFWIGMVLVYAKWQNWGHIGIKDKVLGVPGGALTVSPPLWEFVFFWFVPIDTATGIMVVTTAAFFLAVRLILNVIGVIAIILRYLGIVDSIICMDDRTWAIAKINLTCNNHTGLCGAWSTSSYIGWTPGSAFVGILLMLGVNVPFWMAVIIALPYFFVFGKHFHVFWVQKVGDYFHLFSEFLGWISGSLLAWMMPGWQKCSYSGEEKHD